MRSSPFFEGVSQVDVAIGDFAGRSPTFYYDGSATAAFFAARLSALRRLMPDPRISPARIAPGLGVVAIVCFEYSDTDIGPYNELAITVGLNDPWFLRNFPGRALLAGTRRRQLHSWVHHLPVTTEIARAGGVEFYNYPKFIAGIEFEQSDTQRVCRLREGQEPILTLAGKRISTPRTEQLQLFSHLWMDRQPQSSEFKINAIELGISFRPGAAALELGDRHPVARELAGLLVSRRPIQYVYVPRFEGILYGPEHLTLPLLNRATTGSGVSEPAHAT
jgi:Acetoacetate decarboxylase (ADC)